MIVQGAVHWVDFGPAVGSRPAGRRPAVVLQSDDINDTAWNTTIIAPLTRNVRLARHSTMVLVPADACGLSDSSVINVPALTVINKSELGEEIGRLPLDIWQNVVRALRLTFHSPFNPAR